MTLQQDQGQTPAPTAMGPYMVSSDPPHYLSTVKMSDIPEMVRVLNLSKDIYDGTASFQYPYLESHAEVRVRRALGYHEKGFNTHWAMRTSPDGPLIGWIHAYFEPDVKDLHPETGKPVKLADIGYWVSPEYTRQGYSSRSAWFVVHEILFKEFKVDVVRGSAYIENMASRKILESSGMSCEVEQRADFIPKLQQHRQVCEYSIHRAQCTKHILVCRQA
ncbi:hypothetical protein EMPS_00837 [Entomortierella parvispora]|uniref:N-acetyltransferase domain-containing protein n=1 Tax=Entomortierella parvispora TaxID=205924 RepID=A0A9P3H1P0_9FUNG|nr:hypothetical protein EMPS_00837 [Entomortierella parvispora]